METASEIKVFNKLFAEYHGLFVRFANTYLQDEAAAEDIAVEGIMYYWENRYSLSSNSNIPAYILEVIKHKCLNYLRHLRVREDVEQRIQEHQQRVNSLRIATLEACDPQEIFSSEAGRLVDEALAMMPDKTRRIFIMSRYENKTYPEIAAHFSLCRRRRICNQSSAKTKERCLRLGLPLTRAKETLCRAPTFL